MLMRLRRTLMHENRLLTVLGSIFVLVWSCADPVDIDARLRAKPLGKLAYVLLQMPDVIELELQFAEWEPVKPGAGGQIQIGDLRDHLVAAIVEVLKDVLAAIWLADVGWPIRRPGQGAERVIFSPMLWP
jgi:hypothetical protein